MIKIIKKLLPKIHPLFVCRLKVNRLTRNAFVGLTLTLVSKITLLLKVDWVFSVSITKTVIIITDVMPFL